MTSPLKSNIVLKAKDVEIDVEWKLVPRWNLRVVYSSIEPKPL